jgi:type VI protein secretion system component VasK
MQINYFTLGIIVAVLLVLVIWLVWRNRKDEKAYEKDEIDSSMVDPKDPEKE